ncbi:hypothetical protein PGT21_005950 [Puccinia graminis f. sp. tritici]|uniref:DH domain-containing protein n=1 Tax=Puccinia graminis f. sp. tritici TaxID=56615 RepID=A0A5B0RBS7_PUCGR|nr:hypothetical protein PGT21_005950 [Puccinia graminis f. sp. tritici]KAA1123196.1 hypothetical protein PGTUg99_003798 [Puccinia graminis f. sp. tritici]
MSTRLFPGSLVRAILNHDLSYSNQVTLQPALHNRAFARNLHSRHHQHHRHGRRTEGQPRLVLASGLGLTLIGAAGSFDSDQQRNFCDTNFDTIRPLHSRQPSSRSTLPSFTSSPALDQNGSTTAEIFKSLDDVDDDETSDSAGAGNRELPGSYGSSVSAKFTRRPIPSTSGSGRGIAPQLKKARSNHSIRHRANQSTNRRPPLPAPLPPPANLFSSISSASSSSSSSSSSCSSLANEVATSISPQYPPSSRSTSFSTPLRSSQSLHFTKQITGYQSRHPTHHHFSNPQSRSLTPLTSPNLDNCSSYQQAPLASFSSDQPDFHDYHPCPPELVPFPSQNPVTLPPTKFSNFVKSKIQKTARRSVSQSWSSSLLSSNKHPSSTPAVCSSSVPSSQTESAELDQSSEIASCYRSVRYSATCENFQNFTSPSLSMSGADHEIESLLDQRVVPGDPALPLRSSSSQPFMAEQYRKTSLSGTRSTSVMGKRPTHVMPRRTGLSTSALGIVPTTTVSSHGESASKSISLTGGNSPPLKSVRTQLSRLAQLLAPSPAIKYPPVTSSKAKISLSPSDDKPRSSTALWSPAPSELPSRQLSSTALGAPQIIRSCQKSNALPMAIINWRTTLSDREYRHIFETWGPTEIHRQQLIWELCQTETAFLDSIAVVLDLFISPLREEGQYGTWVVGVPEPVQKLFGDLDQIANFHSEIVMGMSYNRMCEKKLNKAPVVMKFADMMAGFVPRLRIYERYLVCFERVSQLIDRLALDPADHFGSFVRMQSHAAGFGAMTLTSYLLKPIQRLMKYPLFFRQLCETTPLGHPDHQSTSNLWKATDGIIRSMQDVKGLEDDHEALKGLEEQLLGLPDGLVLANRRRKIVIRGTLQMVFPSHKDILKLSIAPPDPESETFGEMAPTRRRMSSSSHLPSLGLHGDFNSKLFANGLSRPLSPVSDSSETSETTHSQSSFRSMNTDTTFDATSSPQPLASEICHQPRSTSGCSSQSAPRFDPPGGPDLNPIKLKPPRSLQSKRSSHKLRKGRAIPSEAVEVILLSDMLILCMREAPPKKNWRTSSRKPEDLNRFRVLEGIGLSRLTCVEDLGGQLDDFDDLVKLNLKPLGGIPRSEINKRTSPSAAKEEMSRAHEHSVYLSSFSVSHSSPIVWGTTGSSGSNNLVGEKDWKNWLKELRKLEVLTHHSFQRQLKHLEQKRRRSHTGRVDLAIKKASSMSNLG